LRKRWFAQHGRVTLLINNAGVALHGRFDEISLDDFRWLMGINFWGVVVRREIFLPIAEKRAARTDREYFECVGIVALPGRARIRLASLLCVDLTEALAPRIGEYLCICFLRASWRIRTPIARRARLGANTPPASRDEAVARFDRLTPTMPDAAAARILKGVSAASRAFDWRDARQIDILQRLRPGTYWKTLARRVQEPAVWSVLYSEKLGPI